MLSEVCCSYCLRPRSETGLLVASPLAAICRDCVRDAADRFAAAGADSADVEAPTVPWGRLSDDELLGRLPEVAGAGRQVEAHLATWVGAARERGISWARIGDALDMTRQSAWERFTDRP